MRLKLVIVFIVILLMMLFGCGNKQDKVLDKVVISYCKALDAGNLDDAISYLSKAAKQQLDSTGGKPTLAQAVDAFKNRKGLKNVKISKREVNGPMATIMFIYNFNDGSTSNDFFPLVKEDGKWKISR